ncbi:MAG: 4'-phosphopantetheinyl transferase family protein [Candidatus Binataceae bacterium]
MIHVWRASLIISDDAMDPFETLLSKDERERAARFHFVRDRRRFTVARAILRLIIGTYLRMRPATVRFSYGPNGKPRIEDACGGESLSFNLAHTGETVLYAFCRNHELGVDVEQIDRRVEFRQIARQFFAPEEIKSIEMLPRDQQGRRFFEIWTRKEAYLKALGAGLSIPLNEFEVVSVERESHTADPKQRRDWTIQQFEPRIGYMGALATRSDQSQISWWDWHFSEAGDV